MTIFYFEDSLLEATEEVASENVIDAIKTASTKHPELRAEIWSQDEKVAVVRPTRKGG